MCNCISKVQEDIRQETGDPNAMIDAAFSFEKPSGSFPIIRAFYRAQKKDGSFAAKKTVANIAPRFCPFCGKPYKEEQATEEQPS